MDWTFCGFDPGTAPFALQDFSSLDHSTISSPKQRFFNRRRLSFASHWMNPIYGYSHIHTHIKIRCQHLAKSSFYDSAMKVSLHESFEQSNILIYLIYKWIYVYILFLIVPCCGLLEFMRSNWSYSCATAKKLTLVKKKQIRV